MTTHKKRPTAKNAERLKAIALMAAAVSVFSVLDTIAKYLATTSGLPIIARYCRQSPQFIPAKIIP